MTRETVAGRLRWTAGLMVALCLGVASSDGGPIAYQVPMGTVGNQTHGGPLGMDFDVIFPIQVNQLGVFDSGQDGLALPITARLYDRQTQQEMAALAFSGFDGTPVDGSRLMPLPSPVVLPAGFHGTMVAEGYGGGEPNGNTFGGAAAWTTDDGGGLLRFVGSSRWGSTPGTFPTNVDTGPANRYAAGTFEYEAQPIDVSAYRVPAGTVGGQTFGGPLGMDFDVNFPITVYHLGVFDSGQDGLALPITARLYNRDNSQALATLAFAGSEGLLAGGSRFKPLPGPVTLPAGFHGTIVAEGYGSGEPNGNSGGAPPAWTTYDGDGLISFVGSSRWGTTPNAFPTNLDGGPANRYAAGTYVFAAATDAIAYQVPLGTAGNQTHGGPLGMDFDVDFDVTLSHLGVFDSGQDGLNLPITARLFNRDTQQEVASLSFAGTEGLLVGGSRFKPLAAPLTLPAGFHGTIVAEGYGGGEPNGNSFGATPAWTTGGAGIFRLVGGSRWGTTPGTFPTNLDTGPANRYAAGTYVYEPSDEGVAYQVPTGTVGTQATFGGSLGMDFDVNFPITLSHIGVFDSGSDGLARPITAHLYDRDTGTRLATVAFTGTEGFLAGGSRFKSLPAALTLPTGFRGTIVAENYGAGEPNGNSGGAPPVWTANDQGGLIAFVGSGRYGGAGTFPATSDGGPANRYAAGTYAYRASTDAAAYQVPAGTVGNQTFDGALGMDFDVNFPIQIAQLGVFDSGSDGLARTITARLYNRDTQEELATLAFSGSEGTLVGGSRFQALGGPVILPAGFHGTIVAENYGPGEPNGNTHGAAPAWTTSGQGGVVTFVGGSRYGLVQGAFPGTPDGGPANRYAAGTFVFEPNVAYKVAPGTTGNQDWGGPLGMDFDVNELTGISHLGVFDSGADGLARTITARLYNRDTQAELASLVFTPDDPGWLIGGSRFKELADTLILGPGFHGTIVAEGYGPGEPNGNQGAVPLGLLTNDGGGLISFLGSSRYGIDPGTFPIFLDGGPANRYAAGTFAFVSAIPEPTSLALVALGSLGLMRRRRRRQ